MISIQIRTIDHNDQRYDTCGDWWWENETLQIRVSLLGDYRYEFLVGVHELIEAFLCKERGITEEEVTKFDLSYKGNGEPGSSLRAPYRTQHRIATLVERFLALCLHVPWREYNKRINELQWLPSKKQEQAAQTS